MRHRHPYDNRYCNACQCTTRHEVKETTYACLRCGVVKYPSRIVVKSVQNSHLQMSA